MKTQQNISLIAAACGATFLCSCTSMDVNSSGDLESGVWFKRLPQGTERENVDGINYYEYNGNYFVRRRGSFVSVESPRSTLREKHEIARGVDYASTPAGGIR